MAHIKGGMAFSGVFIRKIDVAEWRWRLSEDLPFWVVRHTLKCVRNIEKIERNFECCRSKIKDHQNIADCV